jgi:hypothetical protein
MQGRISGCAVLLHLFVERLAGWAVLRHKNGQKTGHDNFEQVREQGSPHFQLLNEIVVVFVDL